MTWFTASYNHFRYDAGNQLSLNSNNSQGYASNTPPVQYKNSGSPDSFSYTGNNNFTRAFNGAGTHWDYQNAWKNNCEPKPTPKLPQDCEPKPIPKPPQDCEPKPIPKPPQNCDSIVAKPVEDCETPPTKEKPAKPTKKTKTPKYQGGKNAAFWGDPHLKGFGKENYEIRGKNNKIYNMLSDKNVQFNTKFETRDKNHTSVVTQAGIRVGDNKISFGAKGDPKLSGKAMKKSHKYKLGDGAYAVWNGSSLKVNTGEYTIGLKQKAEGKLNYLNGTIKVNGNPFQDYVAPHGLLGQTADTVSGKKNNGTNLGKQGGTVIDGNINKYEVKGLWGTNDQFNLFGTSVDEKLASQGKVKTLDKNGKVVYRSA